MKLGTCLTTTLALLAAAGCGSSRTHEFTFDIAPTTGMLAVDVDNFHGSVEIRAQTAGDTATVVGVARASDRLGDQRQLAVDATTIDATLIEDGANAVLNVRTGTPRENLGDHWVDLHIRVPRCQGVRVQNRGGNVIVVGTAGGTEITNRQGVVEFRTNQPVTDPVTLTTTDGNVYYQVPVGSTGAFDLETLDGKVWYRDRVSATDRTYSSDRTHQSRLAGGENPIVARTNRGTINVWVDENPQDIGRLIKRTLPDLQDHVFQKGSQRFRRNLPEDHPEVQGPLNDRPYFLEGY